jgi:hypothetical protein
LKSQNTNIIMTTLRIYLVEKCSEKNEKDKKSEEKTLTNSEEKTTSKTDEKEKSDDNAVKEFFSGIAGAILQHFLTRKSSDESDSSDSENELESPKGKQDQPGQPKENLTQDQPESKRRKVEEEEEPEEPEERPQSRRSDVVMAEEN